jgi:hypothetical protein
MAAASPPATRDPQVDKVVYECVLVEPPTTVTRGELLLLAPGVRAQVADTTIKKRGPREPMAPMMLEEISDDIRKRTLRRRKAIAAHMPVAFAGAVRNPARTPPSDTSLQNFLLSDTCQLHQAPREPCPSAPAHTVLNARMPRVGSAEYRPVAPGVWPDETVSPSQSRTVREIKDDSLKDMSQPPTGPPADKPRRATQPQPATGAHYEDTSECPQPTVASSTAVIPA